MSTELTARELIASLTGLHEYPSPPDVDQRTAAWWHGQKDEDIGWAHDMAAMIDRCPVGQSLYLAHVADDYSRYRQLKEWGYRVAVEFAGARGSGQRKRSLVENYKTDWGHQAARDGLALALWPHLADEIPGRDGRCKQFGCGHQAYARVREAVEHKAKQAREDYRADLEAVVRNRWTRDMSDRHRAAVDE